MKPLLGLAVTLMLIGAVMLLAGFGAAAIWISVITAASPDGYRSRSQPSQCAFVAPRRPRRTGCAPARPAVMHYLDDREAAARIGAREPAVSDT